MQGDLLHIEAAFVSSDKAWAEGKGTPALSGAPQAIGMKMEGPHLKAAEGDHGKTQALLQGIERTRRGIPLQHSPVVVFRGIPPRGRKATAWYPVVGYYYSPRHQRPVGSWSLGGQRGLPVPPSQHRSAQHSCDVEDPGGLLNHHRIDQIELSFDLIQWRSCVSRNLALLLFVSWKHAPARRSPRVADEATSADSILELVLRALVLPRALAP